MLIFLDMDEVLVDFVGGVCKEFGITREALMSNWKEGSGPNLLAPLGKALSLEKPMEEAAFWTQLAYNESFWLNLEPLPWYRELAELVDSISKGAWRIVSAPSECSSSHTGKLKWLKKHLDIPPSRVILTADKWMLAGPHRLLIDDYYEKCLQFEAEGGMSIVFPRHHNPGAMYKAEPVEFVSDTLGMYMRFKTDYAEIKHKAKEGGH